jgi:hypothetical protein
MIEILPNGVGDIPILYFFWCLILFLIKQKYLPPRQGLTNPLARRPGLVISTFGLAEIISCMPDGLVKIYSRWP